MVWVALSASPLAFGKYGELVVCLSHTFLQIHGTHDCCTGAHCQRKPRLEFHGLQIDVLAPL